MSQPSAKRPRITPRNSEANASVAAAANITPFNDVYESSIDPDVDGAELTHSQLHQLGKVIHKPNTPQARTPAKPASASKSAPRTAGARTPNSAGRTPTGTIRSATRFVVRRGPPVTPHGIRALQQRRNAALTPGRGRDHRRSGRVQRETPRDDLRKLSRLMAKHSKPIEPSPQALPTPRKAIRQDLLEDEENEPPPRLSVPLEEGDEDTGSWHEPPRLSLPLEGEEETQTVQSVEGARRALMRRQSYEDPSYTGRLGPLQELVNDDEVGYDEATMLGLGDDIPYMEEMTGPFSDGYDILDALLSSLDPLTVSRDATGDVRRAIFGENQGRLSGVSGPSGSPPALSDGEPTFQFHFPDRRRSTILAQPTTADIPQVLIHGEGAVEDEIDEDYATDEDYETDESDSAQPNITSTRQIIPPTDTLSQSHIQRTAAPKERRISKHGIEYPSLPTSLVKTLAQSFARQYSSSSKLSKDTVLALQQASDWFLEQCTEDVAAYAEHAGRKTIEEGDVVALMKRQRVVGGSAHQTLFSLAQKFLPRELLQEIKVNKVNKKGKNARKRKLQTIVEEQGEEDVTMM